MDVDSVRSERSPKPDIKCTIANKPYYAELVEITDEDIAKIRAITHKTGRSVTTSYSSSHPLIKGFMKKAETEYETDGAPLFLLAYYDKQPPVDYDTDFILRHIGEIAQTMVCSGKWESIWVYDYLKKRILLELSRS